jgi:hypothetical protein
LNTIPRRLHLLGAALFITALSARGASAQQATSVSGVVYSQYSYELADSAGHANAFDVKRAYLNFTRKFDGGISTRITGDVYRASDGSIDYRLKYAYFSWTPTNSPLTFKFGQTQTPWLDWEEGLWGFRMQGTMPLERAGYQTSSDLGLGVDGAWAKQKFNMQLSLMNGEGYHAAEGSKNKDVAARFSLRLLPSDDGGSRGGLRVTVLGQAGANNGGGTRNRVLGMLSYKSKMLTLAGELARVTNSATSADADVKANLFAVYGTLTPKDSKVSIVARVDNLDPNTNMASDATTRVIAGLGYHLSPNVLLLADIDHVSYQGTPTASQAARRSTLLFQTQFTF